MVRVVPVADAVCAVDRARKLAVENGGRFDARSRSAILLWSGQRDPDGGRATLVASIVLRWLTPTPAHVTIEKVAWDAEASSEAEVMRAVELLFGRPPD